MAALLDESRRRAVVCTCGIFLGSLVAEGVIAALAGARYAGIGALAGTAFWVVFGVRAVLTAKPQPYVRRGQVVPWWAWVAVLAVGPYGQKHPAALLGVLFAAMVAMDLAYPVPVVLARRRLAREPALAVNATVTVYGLNRRAAAASAAE